MILSAYSSQKTIILENSLFPSCPLETSIQILIAAGLQIECMHNEHLFYQAAEVGCAFRLAVQTSGAHTCSCSSQTGHLTLDSNSAHCSECPWPEAMQIPTCLITRAFMQRSHSLPLVLLCFLLRCGEMYLYSSFLAELMFNPCYYSGGRDAKVC